MKEGFEEGREGGGDKGCVEGRDYEGTSEGQERGRDGKMKGDGI